MSGAIATDDLDVSALQDLADAGCRVEVQIEVERLRVRALAEGSRQFGIEATGEWSDAAQDETAASSAADAAARNDAASLLSVLPGVTANVVITVLAKDVDLMWVRVVRAFVAEFERVGWFGFGQLVAPSPGVAKHVVVLDAADAVVRAEGIIVHGPSTWAAASPWADDVRASHREGDPRSGSPTPTAVMPIESTGERLSTVVTVLKAVAGALAWLWIADSASVDGPVVTVRLAGNRPIEGALPECPATSAASSVELWVWASLPTQPARRHAVLQAATLQAEQPSDLYSRAGSILDTAQFLFSLSQSGLVQEALAARRSARDAAVAAGRSAADRARSAARSAVDRVLVVVAAGVGVILANKGAIIDRSVAFGLLGLAAALTVGAGLLAFHLDLPGAARSVDLFRAELGQQEVLSPRDMETLAKLPSLVDGTAEVERARAATAAIIGVAILALVLLAFGIDAGNRRTQTPSTRSTTTVTTVKGSTPTPTSAPMATGAPPPPTSNP